MPLFYNTSVTLVAEERIFNVGSAITYPPQVCFCGVWLGQDFNDGVDHWVEDPPRPMSKKISSNEFPSSISKEISSNEFTSRVSKKKVSLKS